MDDTNVIEENRIITEGLNLYCLIVFVKHVYNNKMLTNLNSELTYTSTVF